VATDLPRPAFYALSSGGWRDYVTLLHPPYTAWHLSYVVLGAALAPSFAVSTLAPTLVAFFLALGIGAHALDELHGRPLRTGIPSPVLAFLAISSIAGAAAIGIVGSVTRDPWIGAFVAAGVFIVCAYNLELAGGRFHSDLWFGLAWGGFPLLTAYFATAGEITAEAVAATGYAVALSLAQRRLSTQVRDVRRRVATVNGEIERRDGSVEPVTPATLVDGPERALRAMAVASCAVAVALVMMRLDG
jgi:hypothetical protein